MSEFNAALGLLQLNYIDLALARRGEIDRDTGAPGGMSRHSMPRRMPARRSPTMPISRSWWTMITSARGMPCMNACARTPSLPGDIFIP
jgi:hypothetical protein